MARKKAPKKKAAKSSRPSPDSDGKRKRRKRRPARKRARVTQKTIDVLEAQIADRKAEVARDEAASIKKLQASVARWDTEGDTPLRRAARGALVDFRVLERLDRSFQALAPAIDLAQRGVLLLLASTDLDDVARGLRSLGTLQRQLLSRRSQDVDVVKAALEAQSVTAYEEYRAAIERAASSTDPTTPEALNQQLWQQEGRPEGLGATPVASEAAVDGEG